MYTKQTKKQLLKILEDLESGKDTEMPEILLK